MGPKAPAVPPPPPEAEGEYLKKDLDILYVKHSTLNPAMEEAAVNALREGLAKYNLERDIAGYVREVFDKTYGSFWQCIVGRNYGSYVSFEEHYIFFYLGRVAVVLYKMGIDEDEAIQNAEEEKNKDQNKDKKKKVRDDKSSLNSYRPVRNLRA
ncbi:hypothetical protein WDU94_006902 [Cyamophila willieti]